MNIFDVDTIMLDVAGYPLSYLEFAGTILYFVSVYLISRKNIITWPVGILSVILYGILFYQIQLYSDMLEQGYYFIISIIGWIAWHRNKEKQGNNRIETMWSGKIGIILAIIVTIIATFILSFCTFNFHIWFPAIFQEQASYPVIDALTTVMSFIAMYLTTIRRNEGWLYWIIVDVIAIWLYWIKDVKFISIQYIFLSVTAIYGFITWMKKDAK